MQYRPQTCNKAGCKDLFGPSIRTRGGAEFTCFESSCIVCLQAVLRKECVGTKSDTLLAQEVFWGGYTGYFADLDGQLWEVAYNPHFWIE